MVVGESEFDYEMRLNDSGLRVCRDYPSVICRSDITSTNRNRNGEVVTHPPIIPLSQTNDIGSNTTNYNKYIIIN